MIRQPGQEDVLQKLSVARCPERHAFVLIPPFNTASLDVTQLLIGDDPSLPSVPADLPRPLNAVWIGSTWEIGKGLHWSNNGGWRLFDK
jgi:hypothetical protein